MKSLVLALVLVFLLPSSSTVVPAFGDSRVAAPVSMIRVLANPQEFDGKRVAVVSFLGLHKDGNMHYLHREDEEMALYKNGLTVDFDSPLTPDDMARMNMHYVYLGGVFDARNQGTGLGSSGTIKNAVNVVLWPTPSRR
jgi:hypothetical protein